MYLYSFTVVSGRQLIEILRFGLSLVYFILCLCENIIVLDIFYLRLTYLQHQVLKEFAL